MTQLTILKKRARALRKRLKGERAAYSKLRHRSRSVRNNSLIKPRIGFFTDRLQELELVIGYLDGRISEKEFLCSQNGDQTDILLTGIATFLQS